MVYHKGLFVKHAFCVFIKAYFSGRARQMPRCTGRLPCLALRAPAGARFSFDKHNTAFEETNWTKFCFVPLPMGLVIGVLHAVQGHNYTKHQILFNSLLCGLINAGGARVRVVHRARRFGAIVYLTK